jgi:hypothetical protein
VEADDDEDDEDEASAEEEPPLLVAALMISSAVEVMPNDLFAPSTVVERLLTAAESSPSSFLTVASAWSRGEAGGTVVA